MFLFLDINYGNLKSGGFSYCSHSQGFLSFYKDRKCVENFLEEQYCSNKRILEYCYTNYKEEICNNKEIYSIFKTCIYIVKERARKEIIEGRITFVNEYSHGATLKTSAFHEKLYANTSFVKNMDTDYEFSVKRFITICFYTFLKNAGINFKKRCILDYYIYRYIEDEFNFKYLDVLEKKYD